jgi:ParB family chromosome partitioning protein
MSGRRKQALGKGLGALLGGPHVPVSPIAAATLDAPAHADQAPEEAPPGELRHLPLSLISPNPHQPRRHFDEETLEELAASIRLHGVLQPILVTPSPLRPGEFILLAGERRLRASELAERATIPARVLSTTESEQLEVALIENIQREDLDPVEEARAYQELSVSFGLSQEDISKRVGKSRVAVANALRLLKLSDAALADLQTGALTPGHARAILMLHHPLQQELLRKEIVAESLTVRQAEERARRIADGSDKSSNISARKTSKPAKQNLDVVALQEKLTLRLGCKVRIRSRSAQSGTVEIAYPTLDDLDRVLDLLGVDPDA